MSKFTVINGGKSETLYIARIAILAGLAIFSLTATLVLVAQRDTPVFIRQLTYDNTLFVKTTSGRASAVRIAPNMAMTARHVCELFEGDTAAFLRDTATARVYKIGTYVMSKEAGTDLCVLMMSEDTLVSPKNAASAASGLSIDWDNTDGTVGKRLFAGGYAGGYSYSLRTGESFASMRVYFDQHDPLSGEYVDVEIVGTPMEPGGSGGPALSEEGKLVGITSIQYYGKLGIIPITLVVKFLKEEACLTEKDFSNDGTALRTEFCTK